MIQSLLPLNLIYSDLLVHLIDFLELLAYSLTFIRHRIYFSLARQLLTIVIEHVFSIHRAQLLSFDLQELFIFGLCLLFLVFAQICVLFLLMQLFFNGVFLSIASNFQFTTFSIWIFCNFILDLHLLPLILITLPTVYEFMYLIV